MSTASSAFSALVLLQVLTRGVNFALGAILARNLGPSWYGFANVNLQLVTSSALFLVKEGLRRACQRVYPGGGGAPLAHGVNLAWCAVPLTILGGLVVGVSSTRGGSAVDSSAGDVPLMPPHEYAATVWMFCIAAVLEACAEPAWLYAQANDLIPRRVLAEGAALLLKAAATAWLVLACSRERVGVASAFGYAQLLYSALYTGLLFVMMRAAASGQLLPRQAETVEAAQEAKEAKEAKGAKGAAATAAVNAAGGFVWLPRTHRSAAVQYCWQSVQKYALTEGERVVLVWLSPLAQQGVFALVTNLGSLVARLVLQPIEEIVFAHFSQCAAARRAEQGAAAAAAAKAGSGKQGAAEAEADSMTLDVASLLRLHALLRGATLFGGLFLAFGPAYSWLLLRMLYGAAWSETEAPVSLPAEQKHQGATCCCCVCYVC